MLLASSADVNVQDDEKITPLIYAMEYGNLDITLMLLKEKVDINISYDGITYMHLAARAGRNQEIDLLIQAGGKVDVLDNNGRTPLHVTMQCDDRDKIEEVVLSLINAKANVNIQDEEGLTPLHYAAAIQGAICHYSNSVSHLIKAGAALNTKEESWGLTPLHIALRKNNVVAFCMLLEAGAKFDIKDKAGETIEQELVKGSAMQLNFDRIRKQRGEK